jgi:hypothetical protein
MSALMRIADSSRTWREVRFVPAPDSCSAATRGLFDHLVRAGQHCRRHGQAKRLRSFEIDQQIELGGLLDRQVSGISTLEYLVGGPVVALAAKAATYYLRFLTRRPVTKC